MNIAGSALVGQSLLPAFGNKRESLFPVFTVLRRHWANEWDGCCCPCDFWGGISLSEYIQAGERKWFFSLPLDWTSSSRQDQWCPRLLEEFVLPEQTSPLKVYKIFGICLISSSRLIMLCSSGGFLCHEQCAVPYHHQNFPDPGIHGKRLLCLDRTYLQKLPTHVHLLDLKYL